MYYYFYFLYWVLCFQSVFFNRQKDKYVGWVKRLKRSQSSWGREKHDQSIWKSFKCKKKASLFFVTIELLMFIMLWDVLALLRCILMFWEQNRSGHDVIHHFFTCPGGESLEMSGHHSNTLPQNLYSMQTLFLLFPQKIEKEYNHYRFVVCISLILLICKL